jgi:hypothetical protein
MFHLTEESRVSGGARFGMLMAIQLSGHVIISELEILPW